MRGREWTDDDIAWLKRHYNLYNYNSLAKQLGRHRSSVLTKVRALGLPPKNRVTERVGALNGNWRGGYTRQRGGYLKNNATEKLLHREVVEKRIGRELNPLEVVHHVDGDKTNNSASNLFLCNDMAHHRKVHANLEQVAFQLIRDGVIQFDATSGTYSL